MGTGSQWEVSASGGDREREGSKVQTRLTALVQRFKEMLVKEREKLGTESMWVWGYVGKERVQGFKEKS